MGTAKLDVNANMSKLCGTLIYSAPESLEGKSTKKSDIFSLGTTIWSIFSQRDPFINVQSDKVFSMIKELNMPTIDQTWDTTIQQLIIKCWNREPKQRPSTFQLLQFIATMFVEDNKKLLFYFEGVC